MPLSHTSQNIANVIQEAIIAWGLPEHHSLVTDNASNMLVAGRELGCNPHIGCNVHTLNLAVQKGLNVNSVSHLLGESGGLCLIFIAVHQQQLS